MKVIYKNGAEKAVLLIVEPWAEEYLIESGQSVEVVDQGNSFEGCVEVEYFDGGIIVYGWEGSILSVFKSGVELVPMSAI
ncbi:hypothetical protein NJH78_02265 [Pseudomonas chlororaphis]|uniref:hypothetical protein n=1 Tax=Pseudomonas chlororaphis TaxID=587753 RepID=UPI00209B6354|nr:hypothetical protein [Pseudomonas chlororaphis]MCO7568786.1 hypothetical protein [Pseudomonas chlororaphis]MCO7590963.1 hypothetical protein [Pseudomonas chlororaphis]